MKSNLLSILEREKKNLTDDIYESVIAFFKGYEKIQASKGQYLQNLEETLTLYLDLVKKEMKSPTQFGIFHERCTSPIDFYTLAKNLLIPLVNKEKSTIQGKENIEAILKILESGDNVILFANHQVEPDPTLLAILLDKTYPRLIKNMIAVAGARVTTDPVTVPFTLGQNVLCVYSKKYFDIHEEKKKAMQQHNSTAMVTLKHLLDGGGKCIYIAPSGGRDRKNKEGQLLPAEFDPKSIELMRLVGTKAKRKTHYFPLALYTYPVMPPPEKIKKEIGEERKMCHSPIHVNFGKEIKMHTPSAEDKKDKDGFRERQSKTIHQVVTKLYEEIAT